MNLQPSVEIPKMSQPVEVWNGMLRVADGEAFHGLMERLMKMDDSALTNWNRKMGFQSLLMKEEQFNSSARQAATDDLFPEPTELVSDPHFASVLNSNGEMMIGDLKLRVTESVVFLFQPGREATVNGLTPASICNRIGAEAFTEVAPDVMAARIHRQSSPNQRARRKNCLAWNSRRATSLLPR